MKKDFYFYTVNDMYDMSGIFIGKFHYLGTFGASKHTFILAQEKKNLIKKHKWGEAKWYGNCIWYRYDLREKKIFNLLNKK